MENQERQGAGRRPFASVICHLTLALLAATCWSPPAHAQETLTAGGQNRYVHRLTLYDETGRVIDPADRDAQPYSPRATCGKCHDYAAVSGGWHFNAPDPSVQPGRPGEPWVLLDPATGSVQTGIPNLAISRSGPPVTARGWPGTLRPADVALTPWRFTVRFGRLTPGGGFGERSSGQPGQAGPLVTTHRDGEPALDPEARWQASGRLEIDCMICHAAGGDYDIDERAAQIERLNFRWAPTAAMGLAAVRGSARDAPGTADQPDLSEFDPAAGAGPGGPPAGRNVLVVYDRSRFDADNRVFFDITHRPPPERCLACHSSRRVPTRGREGADPPPPWLLDRDVHLDAGLVCTDCHRGDISHRMARGFPGDPNTAAHPAAATLTCEGCHLGSSSVGEPGEPGEPARPRARKPLPADRFPNRFAAPRPRHDGMPDLHLDRLSCTTCHSGPWPTARAGRVQTSKAHSIGLARKDRRDDEPPVIVEPVFIRLPDGTIEPHRVLEGGFAWPIAHDVRPAAQSLGSGGCADCHAADAPFFFGTVPLGASGRGPADQGGLGANRPMHEFEQVDPVLMKAWAIAFIFRPVFIWFGLACLGVLAVLFLHHALRGLAVLVGRPAAGPTSGPEGPAGGTRFVASGSRPGHDEAWPSTADASGVSIAGRAWGGLIGGAAVATFLAAAVTGLYRWLVFGEPIGGWMMFAHSILGVAFAGCLAVMTATCAERFRLDRPARFPGPGPAQRLAFWACELAAIVTIGSIMASMLKITPADSQQCLYAVHRWAGVALLAAGLVALYLYVLTPRRPGAGAARRPKSAETPKSPDAETHRQPHV